MVLKRAKSRTKRPLKRLRPSAAKKKVPSKGRIAKRDPLDGFVDAAARALDLAVEPAWRGAVKTNLEITLRLASTFVDFPLPDDAEPAPVFVA